MSSGRPSFETLYMNFAVGLSERSTCSRSKVGCVITSTDHRYVFSIGYNGSAAGLENGCDSNEPGRCGCVHGESNAIVNCNVLRILEKNVYVTMLPCVMCAKMLINLGGVQKVYYLNDYRIRDSVRLFERAGIVLSHFLPDSLGLLSVDDE